MPGPCPYSRLYPRRHTHHIPPYHIRSLRYPLYCFRARADPDNTLQPSPSTTPPCLATRARSAVQRVIGAYSTAGGRGGRSSLSHSLPRGLLCVHAALLALAYQALDDSPFVHSRSTPTSSLGHACGLPSPPQRDPSPRPLHTPLTSVWTLGPIHTFRFRIRNPNPHRCFAFCIIRALGNSRYSDPAVQLH